MKALVRDPQRAGLSGDSIKLITGDLHNTTALEQLLDGSDAVVHCAGSVRGASYRDFESTNVEGTRNLLHTMALSGSSRLLMFSSIVAREPGLSWYSRSKAEAERCLREEAQELQWTILRPPAVYGPGDKEMEPIFQAMARGLATAPGDPEARNSLIHVDDLVSLSLHCLENDSSVGRVFECSDGQEDGYSWHDLARVASEVYQRPVRCLRVPAPLLDATAWLILRWSRLTGSAPMLTPPKLRELRHPDWVSDETALKQNLDWNPLIGLKEGLQRLNDSAL